MKSVKLFLSVFVFSAILLIIACEKDEFQPTDVDPERTHEDVQQNLSDQGSSASKVGNTAEVHFGDENAGSPFPPESGHDASYHARDKMVPRVVNISTGGSVSFHMHPLHQIAIYEPGTNPDDIDLSQPDTLFFGPLVIPDFLINDPNDRVVLGPFSGFSEMTWTTPSGVFDTKGKYLVICNIFPHFAAADMYGYVNVH